MSVPHNYSNPPVYSYTAQIALIDCFVFLPLESVRVNGETQTNFAILFIDPHCTYITMHLTLSFYVVFVGVPPGHRACSRQRHHQPGTLGWSCRLKENIMFPRELYIVIEM